MDSSFVSIREIMNSRHGNQITSHVVSEGSAESPIEEKLLDALYKFRVSASTQVKVGPYRADIYISTKYREIVVECDGKEFHKDAARDQKRDEYMEKKGILVLRFTGSQIFRNAQGCAMQIIENISEIYGSSEYQRFLEKYLNDRTIKLSDETTEENLITN